MAFFPPHFAFRARLQACLMAAGVLLSAPTVAAEPQQTKPAAALARLHDFSSRTSELVLKAISLIGIRYKYGGNEPESGLDCSGFVRYLYKAVWGTELPRTAEEISHVGEHVDSSNLQPGDLVFYNTLRRGFSHVGIYLGDDKFIHAPSAGGKVRIESMDVSYWKKRFNGARRIVEPEQN